jgi:hypothetical protein
MQGLSVSRVVDVQVSFAPQAAPQTRFDTLLILGDTGIVDAGEAIREYNTIEEVTGDFGTTGPEYSAAVLFFGQIPQPSLLYIGTWARTATAGRLTGGPLPPVEQLLSAWTTVANGAFDVIVDGGAVVHITGINLAGVVNLNGVASIIQTQVQISVPTATFIWNGQQFIMTSGTTGVTSTVGFLTAPTTGVDLSAQLHMTAALAERSAQGLAPETPVAALARVDGRGWYAAMFAASVALTDAQHLANSAYIEAAADKHVYGATTAEAITLDPTNSTDLASQAMLADYMRTVLQYSITNAYAIASFFGRVLTVNFEGSNTTLTAKFKVQPGVIPELLTGAQASTLANKRCNTYVQYNNGTSIVEEGVMSGRAYWDEIHGLDWLANRIQNDMWNLLYQSPKVPQTNPGVHMLVNKADGGLSQGVINGLIAPGVWNAPGFGTLAYGDYLANGWYTFANSVDTQAQSDREARIAPLIQIAVKLAGAIHFANVLINVNRALLAAVGLGVTMQAFIYQWLT